MEFCHCPFTHPSNRPNSSAHCAVIIFSSSRQSMMSYIFQNPGAMTLLTDRSTLAFVAIDSSVELRSFNCTLVFGVLWWSYVSSKATKRRKISQNTTLKWSHIHASFWNLMHFSSPIDQYHFMDFIGHFWCCDVVWNKCSLDRVWNSLPKILFLKLKVHCSI